MQKKFSSRPTATARLYWTEIKNCLTITTSTLESATIFRKLRLRPTTPISGLTIWSLWQMIWRWLIIVMAIGYTTLMTPCRSRTGRWKAWLLRRRYRVLIKQILPDFISSGFQYWRTTALSTQIITRKTVTTSSRTALLSLNSRTARIRCSGDLQKARSIKSRKSITAALRQRCLIKSLMKKAVLSRRRRMPERPTLENWLRTTKQSCSLIPRQKSERWSWRRKWRWTEQSRQKPTRLLQTATTPSQSQALET